MIAGVPWYGYLIAAVGPIAMHFSAMLGESLLAPVKSGIRQFDAAYNAWPWVPSALCGLFAAGTLRFQKAGGVPFIICAAAAVLLVALDIFGVALSMRAWALKRR